MASYAEIAARGPHQTPEEAAAPPVPSLERTTSDPSSLVDVDSPHISSVHSDFSSQSVQTDTQAERLSHEAEDEERAAEQQARAAEQKARELAAEAKEEARKVEAAAKHKAARAKELAEKNKDNPVVLGNVVVMGLMAAVFGVSAYKRWQNGPVSWSTLGGWTAVVAAVGVGDYFVSRWLFEKYPVKK